MSAVVLRSLVGASADVCEFREIRAVGDLHGDYGALLRALHAADVIERFPTPVAPDVRWNPRATLVAFVVIGDVVDRYRPGHSRLVDSPEGGARRTLGEFEGEEELMITTLNALAAEAPAYGSALIRLLGNHEFGIRGTPWGRPDSNFSSPYALERARAKGDPDRLQLLHLVGMGGVRVFAHIAGFLFVHGGVNEDLIEYAERRGRFLVDWANELAQKTWDHALRADEVSDATVVLSGCDDFAGVLWDRELSNRPEPEYVGAVMSRLAAHAAAFGKPRVTNLVVAHCAFSRIYLKWGERTHTHARASKQGGVTVFGGPLVEFEKHDLPNMVSASACGRLYRVDTNCSRAFKRHGYDPSPRRVSVLGITPGNRDVFTVTEHDEQLDDDVRDPVPGGLNRV